MASRTPTRQQLGPTPAEGLRWVTVNDFTPGIQQCTGGAFSANIIGTPQPLGVGAPDFTWNCMALPEGGLGPMPWHLTSLVSLSNPASAGNLFGHTAITGFHVNKFPVVSEANSSGVPNATRDTTARVWVGMDYFTNANPSVYTRKVYLLDFSQLIVAQSQIDSVTQSTALASPSEIYIPQWFADYRANATVAANQGVPGTIYSTFTPGTFSGFLQKMYPNPATPTVSSNVVNNAGVPGPYINHQGRIVNFSGPRGVGVNGQGGANDAVTNDNVSFTSANLNAQDGAQAQYSDGGKWFGVIASANANELTLINTSGGAYSVLGDLNNPTVTRYDAVQGTGGIQVHGVYAPNLGLVYASQNQGVWAYSGGQQATCISPQLDGNFLGTPNSLPIGDQGYIGWSAAINNSPLTLPYFGQFATEGGYVFAPGNWVYHTPSKSWWFINVDAPNTPTTFFPYWDTTPAGYVVAAPGELIAAQGDVLASPPNTSATRWSWSSHPMPLTKDLEYAEVREFVLIGMDSQAGGSTFTVTLTIWPSNTSFTTTVTIPNPGLPTPIRLNTPALQGTHLTVRFQAAGQNNVGPAPILWEYRYGIGTSSLVEAS